MAFEDDLRKSVVFSEPASDVDTYVDQLNNALTELLDKHAPVRTTRRRPPKRISRWLSDEAVAAKRLRRRLERRWRNTKAIESSTEWPVVMRTDQSTAHAENISDVELKLLAATGRNAGELSMNYFILMIQTNPELMLRTVTCLNRLLSILSAK